jgi:hypothetical protein
MKKWMEDVAKELVETARYMQKFQTHYSDAEEIKGFSMVIEKHYQKAKEQEGGE